MLSPAPSCSLQTSCGDDTDVQNRSPLFAHSQTGSSLDHRLCEYRRALKNGYLRSSAVAEHVFSSNHRVDPTKAMVINTHNHTQTRCMLGSWHIQHHQSPLNREKGTLPGLYAALLSKRAPIWHNPIFVLLLLFIFSFIFFDFYIFSFILLQL